jgi:hypothetical protein
MNSVKRMIQVCVALTALAASIATTVSSASAYGGVVGPPGGKNATHYGGVVGPPGGK